MTEKATTTSLRLRVRFHSKSLNQREPDGSALRHVLMIRLRIVVPRWLLVTGGRAT